MSGSYFLFSLAVMIAGLAAVWMSRGNRRFLLVSGALAAPAGLADTMFVPEYWHPHHLFGPWFSVEGLLFSFGNGCLILAVVQHLIAESPDLQSKAWWVPLWKITVVMLVGFATFLAFWRGAFGSLMIMHAVFAGFATMILFMIGRRSFSYRLAFAGGTGFLLIYSTEIFVWHWADPFVAGFWASTSDYWLQASYLYGIPAEEFLWSLAYGALWPNLMLYGFYGEWQPAVRSHRPQRDIGWYPRRPHRRQDAADRADHDRHGERTQGDPWRH